MQSPPARAEATSVSSLFPRVRLSRRAAEVKVMVDEFPQAQVLGEGGGQEQAGIGHQAVVVKGDSDAVGIVLWQHLLSAPCFRAVSVPKPLSQIQRSTLWLLQGLSPRPSLGGFGLRNPGSPDCLVGINPLLRGLAYGQVVFGKVEDDLVLLIVGHLESGEELVCLRKFVL